MSWNLSDAEAKDDDLVDALGDLSEVTQGWADVIALAIKDNFANEAAGTRAFEPLAVSTIADRRRKGFADGPILQRTGNLKDAATAVKEHDKTRAEVGFEDGHPYAEFHMGEGARSKIPLRDALVLDGADLRDADKVLVA